MFKTGGFIKTKPVRLIAQGRTGLQLQSYKLLLKLQRLFRKPHPLRYSEFEIVVSSARLTKYLIACGGNTTEALTLYRNNIKLCQKCYGIINIFEVAIRNAINDHYKAYFNDADWIRHQLKPGGMLEKHPQRNVIATVIAGLEKTGRYTSDRVVSSMTFGFCTHLFSRQPFILGGQTILQIFPARAKGVGQRMIYNELQAVKTFRNRIAHHEGICFDSEGNKSTLGVRTTFALIVQYIRYLGYSESDLCYGLDVFPDKILQKIDI